MFGKRSDAKLVRGESMMREFMPFISPRRNDSLVYYTMEIDPEPGLAFVEEYNKTAPPERRLTLFTLYLRSLAMGFKERPHVNRFVAGGRLWQRDGVWITFSAKVALEDGAPMVTVKRRFDEDDSLEDMVDGVQSKLSRRRGGEKTTSDGEMSLALRLPPFLIRIAVALLHQANQLGLLPKKMIDDDPLCGTAFAANLGSVDMNAGYHHLWEYGTCSAFAMMGRIKQRSDGSRYFELKYSYDERMADGLYAGITMEMIKERVENPEKLR
jgi:hypothetical protein